jgi:hypothetical protein
MFLPDQPAPGGARDLEVVVQDVIVAQQKQMWRHKRRQVLCPLPGYLAAHFLSCDLPHSVFR